MNKEKTVKLKLDKLNTRLRKITEGSINIKHEVDKGNTHKISTKLPKPKIVHEGDN